MFAESSFFHEHLCVDDMKDKMYQTIKEVILFRYCKGLRRDGQIGLYNRPTLVVTNPLPQ